jgi:gamma-glutamyltranspeptidase/glutathione hydrolase
MDLHTAGHRRGAVAAPHDAAVETGRAVLAEGGNALEAIVAMAASVAAVYPHMSHLGGDGVWLVREPSGRLRTLMAVGRTGANARRELYREHETIPPRGPLAALTVPGAVAGWRLALEAARAYGGRMQLIDLLAPAIAQAKEGASATRSQAHVTSEKLAELKDAPGFADMFLIEGKPPAVGGRIRQTALAATLDHLAHAGLDDFYRGDVGREIAADLERIGSPLIRADLEGCRATLREPLSVVLDAARLFNTPPPTQGLASLIVLALFERLRVAQAEGFDHVHGVVEATKRALATCERVISDPDRLPDRIERYLDAKFLDAEALAIDRRKAAAWAAPAGAGGTVWMGAADASGLVVSYNQSLYSEFGTGVVLPRTGVLMHNGGAGFLLDDTALNALEPGRLPPHPLVPALAEIADGRVMAYGSGQPQAQAALSTRYVHYGMPLARAIEAPRWLLGRGWGANRANLHMESRFDGALVDRLVSAGHEVELLPQPYSELMGHAGAVILHGDAMLEAGHDPRADGGAAGA